MALNNQFQIPSVRKPLPDDVATAAILEKVAQDSHQTNGVGAIGTLLSNEGLPIARDFIRHVLSLHAPEGLAARFPGSPVSINHQDGVVLFDMMTHSVHGGLGLEPLTASKPLVVEDSEADDA
ncbi:hypothetical protein H0H92_006697 [Tricholoma furcatifolium]|nr:hypothetical protein H0H92_006697 [Tricholoma furcatifolium]